MSDPTGQVTNTSRYTVLFDPKELAAHNKSVSVTSLDWTTVLRVDFRWLRHATVVAYNASGSGQVEVRIIGSLEDATTDVETPTEPSYTSEAINDDAWIDDSGCIVATATTVEAASHSIPLLITGDYAWCLVQARKVTNNATLSVWFRGKS